MTKCVVNASEEDFLNSSAPMAYSHTHTHAGATNHHVANVKRGVKKYNNSNKHQPIEMQM